MKHIDYRNPRLMVGALVIVATVVMTFVGLRACSSPSPSEVAAERGREAARRLVESAPSASRYQMEGMVLDARAMEHAYSVAGDDDAAQAFTEAFRDYISTASDSLASVIFGSR